MVDAKPQFSHLVTSLKTKYPDLAYLSLLEPRLAKGLDELVSTDVTNDFVRDIWAPRPLMSSGGFTLESAEERADQTGDLIAIGRYFISNVSIGFWSKNLCSSFWTSRTLCTGSREGYHLRLTTGLHFILLGIPRRLDSPIIHLQKG